MVLPTGKNLGQEVITFGKAAEQFESERTWVAYGYHANGAPDFSVSEEEPGPFSGDPRATYFAAGTRIIVLRKVLMFKCPTRI